MPLIVVLVQTMIISILGMLMVLVLLVGLLVNTSGHFAAGITGSYLNRPSFICPCINGSTESVPSFVGNHYYCESGNNNTSWSSILYTSDPLWDGEDCGSLEAPCCTAPGLPWFHRDYGTNTTTDYIELRVCGDQGSNNEDSPVSFYEIYVK